VEIATRLSIRLYAVDVAYYFASRPTDRCRVSSGTGDRNPQASLL